MLRRVLRMPLYWPFVVIFGLEIAVLVWVIASPGPGMAPSGWIEVGNDTRLLYTDLPDGVRCYRRYYSNQLDCLQLAR